MNNMTDQEREEYLTEHIPYRLHAIDLCGQVVGFLLRYGHAHPTEIRLGSLYRIRFPNVSIFTNPVVEQGLMSCRAMMEFLGVGINKDHTKLKDYRQHFPDTVTLKHFGKELLIVSDVLSRYPNDNTVENALVQTISAGHTGVAHLTIGCGRPEPKAIVKGCEAIRKFVNDFLYRSINRELPPRMIDIQNNLAT